jgi:hypothetical protein
LDEQEVSQRFQIEIRNDGSDACTLRLAVGRDVVASDASFPTYTLLGPSGIMPAAALTGAADPTASSAAIPITVPANGQVQVPYDVRLNIGWGIEAGTYVQELIYQLYPADSGNEIGTQRTRLSLQISPMARIRFAGAGSMDGPPLLDMGPLSSTTRTVSPPFAIRVFSTSPYHIEVSSPNGGALRRIGGSDLIPYSLSLSGRDMALNGGGASLDVGKHTGSTGHVHPVSITIEPDPTRHAGSYSDRVTVTVTAL